MKKYTREFIFSVAVLMLSTFLAACVPNSPTGMIEKKYYANGPWPVTVVIGVLCCDSKGNLFDVYYPTNLGASGFSHPIITWGNGTGAVSNNVAYFLKHMASWGFVVIATQDHATGSGQTILDAANFLVSANANPASIFYSKLNISQIGAIGHSQGAGGAINAMLNSAGVIKTVIPIELPGQQFSFTSGTSIDTSNITQGSVFFVDGSLDIPVSPPTQSASVAGLQSIAAYYNAVPNSVKKLKGTLIGPTHNDVTGQPSCQTAAIPCFNGVYGYLGYPTAWMMDQLQGDSYAHGAFVQTTGEMFTGTKNWELVDSNIP